MYNIIDINYESVNDIKDLWEKNRIYHENNPTISFYKDLGFYPNTLDMQLK